MRVNFLQSEHHDVQQVLDQRHRLRESRRSSLREI